MTTTILNNCSEALRNDGYTWHHDSILFTICHYLTPLENIEFELFADLAGFKNPEILCNGPRSEIVVKNDNKLTVIELSCCHETNFVKTRNYKIKRCSKFQDLCVDKNFRVVKLPNCMFKFHLYDFCRKTSKNLEASANNMTA